jgi:hypothetical protein
LAAGQACHELGIVRFVDQDSEGEIVIPSAAKKPDVKKLDAKIVRLWNCGSDAKEIVEKLSLRSTWRVYNTRKRCPNMRRVRQF